MFGYEEVSRDGHTLDVLTDHGSGLRIMVTRLGAEMVSMARLNPDKSWIGFLYRDGIVQPAKSGWNNHATVMGYYLHRIKNEQTTYRGHPVRGGTHSFLRHKRFGAPKVETGETASLTYRITPDQIDPEEYPFKVALNLVYTLSSTGVRVTFRFQNLEPELAAHVSFGLHPGFACTSLEEARVMMPAGSYVRHFAPGNFLSGEQEQFDFSAGPMPFNKADLPGSFLLELKNVPLPIFLLEDHGSKRHIYLNFSGAPYVTIWSDGNPFICVEPCWGLPDHQEQKPFEQKLGIQEIPAGETLERSFTMSPHLAE